MTINKHLHLSGNCTYHLLKYYETLEFRNKVCSYVSETKRRPIISRNNNNHFKTKINLHDTQRISSYLIENTICFYQNDKSVQVE